MTFLASTFEGGACVLNPDVCWMPVLNAPLPYVNTALLFNGDPSTATQNVRIRNLPVVTLGTVIPWSFGNEPSTGGVVSGVKNGPCVFLFSDTHVLIEGAPAVAEGCGATMNGNNGLGVQVSPSQSTVVLEALE